MANVNTTATIYRNNEAFDFSVPIGTTVRGVLVQLERGREKFRLVDELGRTLADNETFGQSIPAGVVLYTAAVDEQRDAAEEAAARASIAENRKAPLAFIAALAALTLVSTVVALTATDSFSYYPRIGLAVALLAGYGVLVHREYPLRAAWIALVTPLPAAAAVAVLVVHPPLVAGWSYLIALAWGGTVAAFLTRLLKFHDFTDTAVRLWLGAAVALSVVSLAQVPTPIAGPLALALAVVLLSLADSTSLNVPESQLLHLPSVMSTAPSVHVPEVRPPAKITARRVRHTLREGSALRLIGILVACLAALVSLPLILPQLNTNTIEGWASIASVALTVIYFTLHPRSARTKFVRWAPRIVVMLMVCAALAAHPVGGLGVWVIGAIVLATALIAIGIWLNHGMYAPAITRAADVLEQLALTFAIPVAVIAAGFFSAVRAMV